MNSTQAIRPKNNENQRMRKIPITALTSEQRVKVVALLNDDKLILAIKHIRESVECGLAEANDLRKRISYEMDAEALRRKRS